MAASNESLAAALQAGLSAMASAGGMGAESMASLASDEVCQARLLTHLQALDHWRGRLNLTGEMSAHDMLYKHSLDSLAILPWLKGKRVLDIGTGAGFPGLSLSSARPDWAFTLLDSRGKRIEFIRYVLANMRGEQSLNQVELVHSRIEQFRPAELFDTLVVRAVSSLDNLLAMSKHLHAPGVRLLSMKGQYPADELEALAGDWADTAFEVVPLKVPGVDAKRHLVVIDFQ